MTVATDHSDSLPSPVAASLADQSHAPLPAEERSRGWLWFAGGLFSLWLCALIAMAAFTANPPQLNLAQLSAARVVTTATVEDLETGRCRVLRQFTPGELPKTIRVANLAETPAKVGESYLLPLAATFGRDEATYRIVTVEKLEIGPLIYPATPEVISTFEDWQKAGR